MQKGPLFICDLCSEIIETPLIIVVDSVKREFPAPGEVQISNGDIRLYFHRCDDAKSSNATQCGKPGCYGLWVKSEDCFLPHCVEAVDRSVPLAKYPHSG